MNRRATVILDGASSYDPSDRTLTYSWTQTSGPGVSLSDLAAGAPTFTAPTTEGVLTFELVVSNGREASAPDTVSITVQNGAPQVNAGTDQSIHGAATVQLDGSATSDPDGDPMTLTWTQTAGFPVVLSDPTVAKPTFYVPFGIATCTFQLTASDGITSASSTVTVSLVDAAPVANAGADAIVDGPAFVRLDGTASSDSDGDTITYAWQQVGGPSVTLAGAASATPTFITQTADTTLTFKLTVSDGPASMSDTVTVTVYGLSGSRPDVAANPFQLHKAKALPTIGYPIVSLAKTGNTLYAADENTGLFVLDTTDPANLQLNGTYATTGSVVSLALAPPYLYAAADKGLDIYDVSTPASPVLTQVVPYPAYWSATIVADTAYLVGQQLLFIFDVSGSQAALLGSIDIGATGIDVAVAGSYAYVAAGSTGLVVVDVSNSAAPSKVATFDTPGQASGIAVSGSVAYVADSSGGLRTVNVATPASPAALGSLATTANASSVTVSGTYAYVAEGTSGVEIVDVSTPATPTHAAAIAAANGNYAAARVSIAGTRAYIAALNAGLHIVDVTTPTTPVSLKLYTGIDSSYARAVAVTGTTAYVANSAGVQVVDASNASAPTIAVTLSSPADAQLVGINGTRLIAANRLSVRAFDVTTPASPSELSHHTDMPQLTSIAVSGGHLYAAGYGISNGGMFTYDLGTPMAPLAMSFASYWDPEGIAVAGTRAYLARGFWGYTVLDVTDPAAPAQVADINTSGEPHAIAAASSYGYMAIRPFGGSGSGGMYVVDAATGSATWSFFASPGASSCSGVAIQGSTLVLGCEHFWAFDTTTPGTPKVTWHVPLASSAGSILIDGDYSYAGTATGIDVVEYRPPAAFPGSATTSLPSIANSLFVKGAYAYVPRTGNMLSIVSLGTSPPTVVGNYTASGYINSVAVVGNYAYVSVPSSIQILDVSNPAAPVHAGDFTPSPAPVSSTITSTTDGVHLYLGVNDATLLVLDLTAPSAPTMVGSATGLDGLSHLAAADGRVYSLGYGLCVTDVSVPTMPAPRGCETATGGSQVVAENDIAFLFEAGVGATPDKVHVMDATVPTDIKLITHYALPAGSKSIAVADDMLYVSSSAGGSFFGGHGQSSVTALDVTNPVQPVVTSQYQSVADADVIKVDSGRITLVGTSNNAVITTLPVVNGGAMLSAPTGTAAPSSILTYGFTWSDAYPALDESLTCTVTAGSCVVNNVVQASHTAQVQWTLPAQTGSQEMAVVVGNFDYYAVVRDRVRVQ